MAAVSRQGTHCPFISEKFFSCFKPHLKLSRQPALGNSAGMTGGCRPSAGLHLLLMFLFLVYPRSTLCLLETGLCLGLGDQGWQTSVHQVAEVGDSQWGQVGHITLSGAATAHLLSSRRMGLMLPDLCKRSQKSAFLIQSPLET